MMCGNKRHDERGGKDGDDDADVIKGRIVELGNDPINYPLLVGPLPFELDELSLCESRSLEAHLEVE